MVETKKLPSGTTWYGNGADIDIYIDTEDEITFPDEFYRVDEIDDIIEILQTIKQHRGV